MPSVPLDCTLPAERVLLALRDEPWPFALTGRWAGGGAIVGSAPKELLGGAGRWWFESLGEPEARLDDVRARLAAAPASVPPAPATFAARTAAHIAAVRGCVARIAAGEMSRVHLCPRLEAQREDDVVALFVRAAARLRPAYGACFVAPWGGVASCSPEPFLRPSAPAAGIRGGARLRTAFPAASVTGAPKARAMTAIAELETTGREVHSGLIGFAARRPGWSSASPSGHLRPAADGCGSASAAPSTPILTRRVRCRSAWSKPDAWLPRWAA